MNKINAPFEPESFRKAGHRLVDTLADYLQTAQQRELPVLSLRDPNALLQAWDEPITREPAEPKDDPIQLVQQLLDHANHLHHPGYIGHQVAVPLPMAALLELTNALLNNGMAVYEMGQLQTILERRVVDYLAGTLGFDTTAGGIFTHGGSLGNLTALLAARQAKSDYDIWTEGQRQPLSVLVSEQAHYCVARAVQAMGWGAEGAWPVATDDRCRMDLGQLPQALQHAEAAGRRVIAVVASCCTTATGSLDPLEGIADFCAEHELWLHVDGAHGAALALSQQYRHRVAGIARADSVVWDLHKMMGLPALNTALLFRDGRRTYEAFAQEASYLFEKTAPEEQWFNVGQRTLECTKRGMAVTAYGMLRSLGGAWFEAHVDALIERTAWFEELLRAAPDFEVACAADANILCFRHAPPHLDAAVLDGHQERLRKRVLQSGAFYIVQTRLGTKTWLRVTVMNPMTTRDDFERLMEALRS